MEQPVGNVGAPPGNDDTAGAIVRGRSAFDTRIGLVTKHRLSSFAVE